MLRIKGRTYWGDKASLQGWETEVGHFQILDARPEFRRYHACKAVCLDDLQKHYDEIAKLAEEYNTKPTNILYSKDKYYNFEKHMNIFFLGKKRLGSDLDTIQRTLETVSINKEVLLSIDIDRDRMRSSVVVDIKDPLKKVHSELLKSLDAILFST